MSRGRRSLPHWTLLGAWLALAGCSAPIPRNAVSDFFAKDFELPEYRSDEDQVARRLHRFESSSAAASLGGGAGAFAGGYAAVQRPAAIPALGSIGGAATAAIHEHAAEESPLPDKYDTLHLAVPVITTDPNAGVTVGVMPISIFREGDRITNIFAPQVTWNAIDGEGALFRMRRFYRSDANLSVDAGSTTNGAHNYDVQYRQAAIGPSHLFFFRGRFHYATELNDRFYGLGNDSESDAQSNYSLRRTEGQAGLGIDMPRTFLPWIPLKLEFTEILSSTRVGPAHISSLPSSRAEFPSVPGMQDRIDLLAHRFTLTIDARDKPGATTSGYLIEGYYEIGDSTLASDFAFAKGGFTAQGVIGYLDDELATAGRFAVRFVGGRNVPFYEQTQLGGKTDQTSIGGHMSLRGYGDGRFIAKNGFTLGIEERWNFLPRLQDAIANLLGKRLFDNNTTLQVAAFAEIGRVFEGGEKPRVFKDLKGDVGPAIRLLVPESDIVLSIDVGISKEGVNPFVDLGYTF